MVRLPRTCAALVMAALVLVSGCRRPAPLPRPEQRSSMMTPVQETVHDPTPELEGGPESTGRESNPPPLPHTPELLIYVHGNPARREVALTFDDGPDRTFTPRVLDVLKAEGVRATFFLVGRRVEANPDIARRIIAEGHELGNHSWAHAKLSRLTADQIRADLVRTEAVINQVAGPHASLFRPPYGEVPPKVVDTARALGLRVIFWNVDSLDWKSLPALPVALNVLPAVRQGGIILHHSAGGKGEDLTGTVDSLPLTIRTLKGQGYRFVTVTALLR